MNYLNQHKKEGKWEGLFSSAYNHFPGCFLSNQIGIGKAAHGPTHSWQTDCTMLEN